MDANVKALVEAVERNFPALVKKILSRRTNTEFNINEKDEDGRTVLHRALRIEKISVTILKLLLENNVQVNVKDRYGESPLHFAVRHVRKLSTIELLLQHGADLNCRSNEGVSPFDFCFENSLFHVTRGKKNHPLELRNLLLEYQTDPSFRGVRGRSALHYAAARANYEVVQKLLEMGMDASERDDDGNTPLHLVSVVSLFSDKDNLEKIRLLVAGGADVNARNNDNDTPLSLETRRFGLLCTSLADCLLKLGADPNIYGNVPPLCYAISCLNTHLTKLLINHGADVHYKDAYGCSLLNIAMGIRIINIRSNEAVTTAKWLMLRGVTLAANDHQDVKAKSFELLKDLEREMSDLKTTRICKRSPLTHYDLLMSPNDSLVRHLRQKDICAAVKSGKHKKKFPNFSDIIDENYQYGLQLKTMTDDFMDLLNEVFGTVLSRDVIVLISRYFGEDDLKKCFNNNSTFFYLLKC